MNFGLPKESFQKVSTHSKSSNRQQEIEQAEAEVERLSKYNQAYGGQVDSILQRREDALNRLEKLRSGRG